ncbi:MAG: hypothetical protein QM783_00095 [Phycisphaerales bacterium]
MAVTVASAVEPSAPLSTPFWPASASIRFTGAPLAATVTSRSVFSAVSVPLLTNPLPPPLIDNDPVAGPSSFSPNPASSLASAEPAPPVENVTVPLSAFIAAWPVTPLGVRSSNVASIPATSTVPDIAGICPLPLDPLPPPLLLEALAGPLLSIARSRFVVVFPFASVVRTMSIRPLSFVVPRSLRPLIAFQMPRLLSSCSTATRFPSGSSSSTSLAITGPLQPTLTLLTLTEPLIDSAAAFSIIPGALDAAITGTSRYAATTSTTTSTAPPIRMRLNHDFRFTPDVSATGRLLLSRPV